MRIDCPDCGPRDAGEFSYQGDATLACPGLDDADAGHWHDYVYERVNPRGEHTEYWQHVHGCRGWIKVVRNTLSHEVISCVAVLEWPDDAP
jgi:sarcosine oxidase subunit delta